MTKAPSRLCLLAATATLIVVPASHTFAQGSLTPPPGAPAPTMKTLDQIGQKLDQIEPRIPLAAPSDIVTISQSGSYYLTGDVYALGINASDVTVDLNGFAVRHSNNSTALIIGGAGPINNVTIRNGSVLGPGVRTPGGSNPWEAAYVGSFGVGIFIRNAVQSVRLEKLTVRGFQLGIICEASDDTSGARLHVDNCVVRDCATTGMAVRNANIRDTTVQTCGGGGIQANLSNLENVIVERNAGVGIDGTGNTIRGATVRYCGSEGIRSYSSNFENVNVSFCNAGIVTDNSSLERVTLFSNRAAGFFGNTSSIANSVFRSNGAAGVQGTLNTLKNVSANNNTGSGIAGDSFAVDGAIANGNGGSGVIGAGSTVRGVRASSNAGAGVWCDESTINECMISNNAADGIRGVNSTINGCRSSGNDTNKTDGYTASDIYWSGGRQQANVAGSYSPAAPAP